MIFRRRSKPQSQHEVIDIAKTYGIDSTVDTLEARAKTLPFVDEQDLDQVKWHVGR